MVEVKKDLKTQDWELRYFCLFSVLILFVAAFYFNTPKEVCDFLNNICDSNFVTYKKDDLGYWRVDSTFFTIKKIREYESVCCD